MFPKEKCEDFLNIFWEYISEYMNKYYLLKEGYHTGWNQFLESIDIKIGKVAGAI